MVVELNQTIPKVGGEKV